jgi:hypothetical protein
MHAVLQESIRMVTTVPVNQRVNLDEDVTIGGQVRHSYSQLWLSASAVARIGSGKHYCGNSASGARNAYATRHSMGRLLCAGRAEGLQHQHPDVCHVQEREVRRTN